MKGKIFKVVTIMLLLATLTLTNFIYVGVGLISYAVGGNETNHQNVEFSANIKDNSILELEVSVKNEGEFNGKITLEDSNFNLKEFNSEFVQKTEGNTITLNKINVGTTAKIEIPVESKKSDVFNTDLFSKVSKLSLNGIYKNSNEKETEINATKEVRLEYTENNTDENVENDIQVITNKIAKVSGEEKRVVQVQAKVGLKDNNYPIQQIELKMNAPTINGIEVPTLAKNITFNTMTHYNYNYDGSNIQVVFNNEANEQNNILWRKQGNETVVITLIYDKEANVDGLQLNIEEKVKLYNQKELTATNNIVLNNEIKDEIVKIQASNNESAIYKGKLYSGIERSFETKTKLAVNLANVGNYINIKEEPSKYITSNGEFDANVIYNQTKINKETFNKVFGEDGEITINNQNGEAVGVINKSTMVDEQGNMVIDYAGKEPTSVQITTTKPIAEGNVEIIHSKTIRQQNKDIIKQATQLNTKINYEYGTDVTNNTEATTILNETTTEATLELNKSNLSTLETNNVEIRATLKSSKEQNDLYKNPKIQIVLPNEIANITVNSINKLFADEFKETKAQLENIEGLGRVITVELEGEQKQYTSDLSDGIQIVINADITFEKSTPTKELNLVMKYSNENGEKLNYELSKNFNIVSKYGLFTYSKINVPSSDETLESTGNEKIKVNLGAEEQKEIIVERNIINNYESNVENVNIEGEISEITNLQEITTNIEGSKIYYAENSDDWKENIENISQVKKYKVEIPANTIAAGQVINIKYKATTAKDVEYNKVSNETLNISYTYGGQNLTEKCEATFTTTAGVNKNINSANPSKEENIEGFGKLTVTEISSGEELKNGQEIKEGQNVKVKVQLSNTTGNNINNLKLTAKQTNAVFFINKVTQETNTQTLEPMDVTHYIKDENTTQRDFTLENLKAGETATFEYEYSVAEKPGEETNGTIILNAENKQEKNIDILNNKIKDADLAIDLFNGNNLEVPILADGVMVVVLDVKNISNKDLKNINIEIPLNEYVKGTPEVFGNESGITLNKVENGVAVFNVESIKSGEKATESITFYLKDFEEKQADIKFSAIATVNNEKYISNELARTGYQNKAKITVVQQGSVEGETVKKGDKITYTTTIKNESDEKQSVKITDSVQSEIQIEQAYLIRNGQKENIEYSKEENYIECYSELNGNSEAKFVVESTVYDDLAQNGEITNTVAVITNSQYLKSNPVTYKFENAIKQSENNENQNQPEEENNNKNEAKKGTISGLVWLDANRNGQRDSDESTMSNIEVMLLNTDNGEVNEKITTGTNGKYEFKDVSNGKYIVAIKYDTTKYSTTEYRKSGVNEELNSDMITKSLNGEQLAITDEININESGANNVDVGLTENKIFDLSLNKFINKITIQNSVGTKMQQYNKEKLAKTELPAKQISGSTVIVEYGIEIKNEGEIPGYASEIIDYLPSDFKFSSEMNKSWYISTDNQLHSVSLANQIINPGESKTITLVLTKTMTENNIGTSVNTAEIAKTSNSLAIADKDSTPGNKASNEDDYSDAKVIISIKTGGVLIAALVVSIMLVIFMIVAIMIIKKRGEENE